MSVLGINSAMKDQSKLCGERNLAITDTSDFRFFLNNTILLNVITKVSALTSTIRELENCMSSIPHANSFSLDGLHFSFLVCTQVAQLLLQVSRSPLSGNQSASGRKRANSPSKNHAIN